MQRNAKRVEGGPAHSQRQSYMYMTGLKTDWLARLKSGTTVWPLMPWTNYQRMAQCLVNNSLRFNDRIPAACVHACGRPRTFY